MVTRVVGDVAVRVGADVGPLKIGLQQGGKAVDKFGRRADRSGATLAKRLGSVTKAALAMSAGLVAASRQAIKSLDGIAKTADKIGVTTDELQELRFAAKSAGVESRTLDMALQRFTRRASEAAAGTGEAKAALEEMGIELKDSSGNLRPTSDLLADVADALKNTTSQADRVRLSFKLFDSEGVAMVNMLQNGSDAFREIIGEAKEFGAVIDESVIRAAEELEDKMGKLGSGIKAQLSEALVGLGPLLVSVSERVLGLALGFNALTTLIGDTFAAVDEFLNPLSRLEAAHNEVVAAMGDEIRQSQQLDAALKRGGKMSEATARLKLQEAQAHYQSARAKIEDARAATLNSDAMGNIEDQIKLIESRVAGAATQKDIDLGFGMGVPKETHMRALETAMERRNRLLAVPEELNAQLELTTSNIERLEALLANVKGGIVSLGDDVIEPIKPGEGEGEGGGGSTGDRASKGGRDGSALDDLLGLSPDQLEATKERMAGALEVQAAFYQQTKTLLEEAREQGIISQEQFNSAEQALQADHNAKMRALKYEQVSTALGAAGEMFDGLAKLSKSGGERILRIGKIFSAAQAFVDTMAGAAKALKLPYPANIAAAAQVIATGAGFVAAIKGATAGGASGGAATGGGAAATGGGAAQPETAGTYYNVTLHGDTQSTASVGNLLETINEAIRDGGRIEGITVG